MLRKLLRFFKRKKDISKIVENSLFDKDLQKKFTKEGGVLQKDLEVLEINLLKSDIGVAATKEILVEVAQALTKNISLSEVKDIIKTYLKEKLKKHVGKIAYKQDGPLVILAVGVNGSGKTTNLGKLACKLQKEGKKTLLAACDTFRAAATAQLEEWVKRAGVEIVKSEKEGGDPAAVAYAAITKAKKENYDCVLIDTAGRLQNQTNLMEQLGKIIRVIKKIDDSLPHHSFLVLDGTVGQNAHKQAEIFSQYAKIDGLIVTKLDGTTKGGILVPITEKYNIPVYFVGKGEGKEDLEEFEVERYVEELL